MAASTKTHLLSLAASAGLLLAAIACQKQNATPANNLAALPLVAAAPTDNLPNAAKVDLGRALFWDPVLSGGRDVSCASCHHPANAYADALDLAIGANGQGLGAARHFRSPNTIPFGQRNTSTVLNAAFNGLTASSSADPSQAPMFWDSRAQSLEAQALQPLAKLEEMRGHQYAELATPDSVVARLRAIPAYTARFQVAFGGATPITAATVGQALACFQRTLVATDSPFDQYERGNTAALTQQQVQGLQSFLQSGCGNCHGGPMLSDYQLHVMGVADNAKNAASDAGAGGTYAFRTPSLRNVALTAPYMHSGTLATLGDVLDFYDNDRNTANPHVSTRQRDAQFPGRVVNKQAIIAFLNYLTDNSFDKTVPTTVPSGLPVGGNIR